MAPLLAAAVKYLPVRQQIGSETADQQATNLQADYLVRPFFISMINVSRGASLRFSVTWLFAFPQNTWPGCRDRSSTFAIRSSPREQDRARRFLPSVPTWPRIAQHHKLVQLRRPSSRFSRRISPVPPGARCSRRGVCDPDAGRSKTVTDVRLLQPSPTPSPTSYHRTASALGNCYGSDKLSRPAVIRDASTGARRRSNAFFRLPAAKGGAFVPDLTSELLCFSSLPSTAPAADSA